ncbi:MAG: DUF1844 domain-containing protein [Rubripirellula sp.]|nr:DUF1844 domain-containing protein [Rubripirellula sp.]
MSDNENAGDETKQDKTEPSINVDDNWKEQVALEQETAAEIESASPDAEIESASPEADIESTVDSFAKVSVTGADPPETDLPEPPPASFSVLISMLFTQAMAMLGQMPDPATGESKVNKPFAKHYIDTLEMLETKTKGNLDDQESAMLNEALHALRMMYVDTRG